MSRIAAASTLVALAAASVSLPVQAQTSLADSAAWEHLGPASLVPYPGGTFAFTGDDRDPTIWISLTGVSKLTPLATEWVTVSRPGSDGPLHFDLFDSLPDTVFSGGALSRSTDGGQTFQQLRSPIAGDDGRVGDYGALDRIPAGAPFAGRLVVDDTEGADVAGFLYSDDAGDTWTRSEASPLVYSFQIHAFRSGRVLAAGFYGAALSDDGAVTFRAIPQLYESTYIAFDLTEMEMLDGFTTGRPGDSTEGRLLILGVQVGRPGIRLWASDDEGTTWRDIHGFVFDGPNYGHINAVPASVGGGPGWAVATSGAGVVYATTDGAETWTEIGQVPGTGPGSGLPTSAGTTAVGPDGEFYVAVQGRGPQPQWSWKTKGRISDAIRVAVASEASPILETPSGMSVSVRPNPVGGRAEAVLSLAEAQQVRVSVVDVRGREVAVLLDGPVRSGEERLEVNTASWPAGVYVVRMTTGGQSASARLVVAR